MTLKKKLTNKQLAASGKKRVDNGRFKPGTSPKVDVNNGKGEES